MEYLEVYSSWLKQNMSQRDNDGVISLVLPYLDKDNDFIEIYIVKEENGFTLTDDGETLNSLEMEGVSFSKDSEKLNSILDSFGVLREENELIVKCQFNELALKIHMLSLCMMQVSNYFASS